ncbi:doublecortin domain-containing protein 1 isoform X3 [Mesocricetus auratus]|uniref:Doublecortin domain-containing protein 1 isoform X3 n=1 Tax=Mesocricetus auratus TaxID=10036 RepID=A0ABM2XGL5_MESAU|nr:doublecortin domain-containing protein 1 isoform X3 [Mesocricetus auratus]
MPNQAKAVIKTTDGCWQLQFGPNRLLYSAAVSEGSGLQDCSTHQTASDHSKEEPSNSDSCKSKSKNNSCFMSASKRNRPVSAPVGQSRASESSLKPKSPHNCQVGYQRQPRIIRVTAYKNGSGTVFANIAAPTIALLLEACTHRLNLNMAARRVFLADGSEAFKPEDIPHEANVYVSTGEPFLDPFKKIKDHLLLMKKVTWTMRGLMLPTDVKRQKTKPALSKRMKTRVQKTAVRILVFKNGMGQDGHEITVGKETMRKVLDICTMKMNLDSPARYIYDMSGRKVEDISKVPVLEKCLQDSLTPLRGPLWVSKGEGFSPSGAKMYIQGVLGALYPRLKSAKNYYKQLDLVLNEQKAKITAKAILSMTPEEYKKSREDVSMLIDELQTAIKSNRGHLAKLGPQLQAEQEQFSSYVCQHIKSLPANTIIPGGLHLKLLLRIHQRLQGSSSIKSQGLHLSSARIFDEHGQEIKSPLQLKNGQKIWLSYGKTYRSPLSPVLALTFDRVAAFARDGTTAVYKTVKDADAALLFGCDDWTVCEGFPVNIKCTSQQIPDCFRKVALESHFLQNKVDPNIVLYASVSIRKHSFSRKEVNSRNQMVSWPEASMWLITKTGMILNRAITQGCLAIGHPVRVETTQGASLEGYKLLLQKRHEGDESQKWIFGTDGCIYSKAYPQFVLTYLEEFTALGDMSPTGDHINHRAWTISHQEHDRPCVEEGLQKQANSPLLKQLPEPSDTHDEPQGSLEETEQLPVALLRKLGGKHPKAPAQRWAIKHKGIRKPGQWKHSKVENPLWKKLMYMWPVLPSGQLNEAFDWPIEGLLVPNSPPMKRPACKTPEQCAPVRLRILRNGDKKNSRTLVMGPDLSPGWKSQNVNAERKEKSRAANYSETERNQIEFHHLLERCTEILNLPSAARRLFNEKGKEICSVNDLQRDELVYVSCGEHWINPDLSIVQQRKQVFLRNLEFDISKIKTFCSMCKVEALVLEVQSDLVSGGKLAVNKPAVILEEEKQVKGPEGTQMQNVAFTPGNASRDTLDSHARAHLRMEACCRMVKYAWQDPSYNLTDGDNLPKKMEKEPFENVQPQKKHSHFPKHSKLQKLRHQEFEYRNRQIISLAAPQLVLGVQGSKPRSGTEVILMEKKSDDGHQHWTHKEESRTFHLMSNPDLVLAVSMTKAQIEARGYPVIIQKYKPCSNGAANQKWHYMENTRTFIAFHSTALDKEVTAANSSGLCTSSVTKENIDQPGYCYLSPDGKKKMKLCLACGQSMRAEKGLKQLLPSSPFFCVSGSEQKSLARRSFKVINIAKADLSTYEAENTLKYYEERLSSLWMKTRTCTASHSGMVASYQKAVKVIAYKNGDGYRNGKLIVAGTFHELLAECTERLGLTRAASKVYARDGTSIRTLHGLVLWAIGETLSQRDPKEQESSPESVGTEESAAQNAEENSRMKMENRLDCLEGIDKSLLAQILKSPIAIWVSCGEPFLPLNAPQNSKKLKKQNWLKTDQILADLDTMRHKMRQLKGRRVAACQPATMVPTQSPLQPVVVEGGWTEQSQEEMKLMELIRQTEAQLSEGQELQSRRSLIATPPKVTQQQHSLYQAPRVKRVWAYQNGGSPDRGAYAWASTISELLDDCTARLKMSHPAKVLYTSSGELIQSWDNIERDMTVCVSSRHGFMTSKEKKRLVEVKANYARIRRQQGPEATDIVLSPSVKLLSLMQLHN